MKSAVALRCLYRLALFLALVLPLPAEAGHLFTQASGNTPIALTAGQGIQITQQTFEPGGFNNGRVSLNFSGDWSSGDAIRVTIGSYSQTFTFNSPLAGAGQSGSALSVVDPTLTAAGITQSPNFQWTVAATSGSFTFEGYRVYIVDGTFNGTSAAPINQSQVVSTSANFVPASTPINVGLAREFDALTGTAGELGVLVTLLSTLPEAQKSQALRSIAPETSRASEYSAMNTATAGIDTVQLRLDAVRSGDSLAAHAFNWEAEHKSASAHDEGGRNEEGLSSGDSALKRNLWLKGFGGMANQDARDGFAGFGDHTRGTMLGFDTAVGEGWMLGAAFGYARTNVDMNDYRSGDGVGINTYQLTAYFSRVFSRWYLDGMLTYATQQYSTTRDTHVTGTAAADFSGQLYGGRLVANVPFALSHNVTLTPYAGLEVYRITQSSYTETGAGVLSLNVASASVDRIRSLLGAELAMLKKLDSGGALRPSIKLSWRHETNDDGITTVTSLAGGGNSFQTLGQAPISDIFGLGARLYWERNERMSFAIELTGEAGAGYYSLGASIMGGWRF
jgi:outer membrane autotransporter protein